MYIREFVGCADFAYPMNPSGICVSHLYNLRGGKEYISKRRHWTKTRSTKAPIGERRAPRPEVSPGYLRIDSVNQGD